MGSSSSPRLNPSKAATASSVELLPPTSKACAPAASTEEPSPPLVFGLDLGVKSSLPDPTVAIAELAARLGIKRSPAKARVVLVGFCLSGPFLDLLLEGVLAPVPIRVKSETPSSRARRGVCVALAMLDLGESR